MRNKFRFMRKGMIVVLLIVVGVVFAGLAYHPSIVSQFDEQLSAHTLYNEGVEFLNEGRADKAQEKFMEAIAATDEGSGVGVSARYNLATVVLAQGNLNSEILFQVKGILEDALRFRPEDTDIRKNLELVQNVLLQTLKRELEEAGGNPEGAEEMVDENSPKYPEFEGPPGRTEGNERDY